MRWVLLWAVLLLGAATVYGLIGLRLWRAGKALVRELGAAADRLDAVSSALEAGADWNQPHEAWRREAAT